MLKLLALLAKLQNVAPQILQMIELLSQILTQNDGGKEPRLSGKLDAEQTKVRDKLVEAGVSDVEATRGVQVASAIDDRVADA